jgi:hypothetical protein
MEARDPDMPPLPCRCRVWRQIRGCVVWITYVCTRLTRAGAVLKLGKEFAAYVSHAVVSS